MDAIRDKIRRGNKRILVVLPTGAGKGYMAARVMQLCAEKGNSNIFFADQRELIFQLQRQLDRLELPSRVLMSGVQSEYASFQESSEASNCILAAKDTLWARAFRSNKVIPPQGKVIQVDEAHKSLSQTWKSVMSHYSDSIVIGWTATPCRTDGRGLGEFYDCMIQAATYEELQKGGYLVPVRIFAPDRPDLKGLKVSRGDYTKGALEQRMNRDKLVGNIIEEWRKNSDGRASVVFACGIQHSIHIRNEFRRIGVMAEHIDGSMEQSQRDDIMKDAADGTTLVLCNYGVLHTGVDVPQWKYLVCARPTKSFSLWRQMGGRIQRPLDGHDHCVIQDHSDNALHFGFPDEDVDWTLDSKKKAQDLHRNKQKEKQKKDPYACEKCSTVYRGPHCPSCGHKPEKRGKDVAMSNEELAELERKKRNKNATQTDKQKAWDKFLGWAVATDKKVGAAFYRYKQEFGVGPRGLQNLPKGSEWQMTAKEYYHKCVKPAKEQAKREREGVLF